MKVILFLCLILLAGGCGIAKDTSKGLEEIKPSLRKANERQELLKARELVKKSRLEYNKCLSNSSGKRSQCEDLRLDYERKTAEYADIQQK